MIKRISILFVAILCLCSGLYAGQNLSNRVNKFGRAPSGVQSTATDIWDLADATPTQSVWLPPETARVHAIVSSDTGDDGSPAGLGAQTIRVYGLTAWTELETSEDVILDGTTPVNTTNSYVIINRMKVLTTGASNSAINIGNIKATAAVNGTITAQINAGEGQTQMAIYGIPSTQDMVMDCWYGTVNKAQGAAASINFSFTINDPVNFGTNTAFVVKNTRGLQSTGKSADQWFWPEGFLVEGPAIIKIQGLANTNDVEGSAGFNGRLQSK
ncbi:hypothetical protein HOD41_07335 [bacterium]|jgi:hypothetical protein|nr:hypothetical protein [bacterium]